MKKQKFTLPNMVLHREDLENVLTHEEAQKVSNSDMEKIAKGLSNALMNDWSICLEVIRKEVIGK